MYDVCPQGDVVGTIFFLFVDFMGASYSTPSGEGDPASDLVTEYTIEYDSR